MKLITLEQWDAASDPERQKLLDEGAILSQEDMDRLSLRLKARLLRERNAEQHKPEQP